MTIDEFLRSLEEYFELEEVPLSMDTILDEVLDSLRILTLIAYLDKNFQLTLDEKTFQSLTTVKSLIEVIGPQRFKE